MSRWLSVFLLLLALLGFGVAMQSPDTRPQATSVGDTVAWVADAAQPPAGPETPGGEPSGRLLAQAESDTAVDVTLLFEPVRAPLALVTVAATPSRFGWTPVASPFLEGLQRPPRAARSFA